MVKFGGYGGAGGGGVVQAQETVGAKAPSLFFLKLPNLLLVF